MTDRTVTAQITDTDHPLQGAEVRIEWRTNDAWDRVYIDVHLDAIGEHPARWVPIQDVDQLLADLDDADPPEVAPIDDMWTQSVLRIDTDGEAGFAKPFDLRIRADAPDELLTESMRHQRDHHQGGACTCDPLAEVAASHDDRAAARTERRAHDAG